MKKLKIEIENCYGIKKLNFDFNFTARKVHAIYAANGVMKSSFAKTFYDISTGNIPKDEIYIKRIPKYKFHDETNNDINKDDIFVIESYKEKYGSQKISTLLVNKKLKDEYEKIHQAIDAKKDELLIPLKNSTGLKNDIDKEFTETYNLTTKDFYLCLENISSIVKDENENLFSDIVYNKIFNDKVIGFLNTKDFKKQLSEYVEKYNELIESSTYFKKGIFNHNNASAVCKNLNDNGFFSASHSVSLNGATGSKNITTQKELNELIDTEKDIILKDSVLKARFKAIDDAITKNIELKTFRLFLENNQKIIPELLDLDKFKKTLWISYLKEHKTQYLTLLEVYIAGKNEIKKIVDLAKKEETEWRIVIDLFNERFSVPFRLEIKNQDDVVLKDELPNISFVYDDGSEMVEVTSETLLKVLSTGEKRALYILNIIFELEARKKNKKSLLIIDDIADSFDYKNKYAIIEYLKDILESDKFFLIILSHNFDFYRTIVSRLGIPRKENCHMVVKTASEINLRPAAYLDVFSHWRKNLHTDNKMLIASIPFIRNLIEYSKGDDSEDYLKMTSLLHIKKDSESLTVKYLENTYKSILQNSLILSDTDTVVFNLIFKLAEEALTATDQINLENKIILSIAIRLTAEKFMIKKIADSIMIEAIHTNQTMELFKEFKKKFSTEKASIKILDQVNLMTPENIHFNSFMYEPILDISDHHLKKLYSDVKILNT